MVKTNFKKRYKKGVRYQNPEYANWVSLKPCIYCNGYSGQDDYGIDRCDVMHVKTRGMGNANKEELGNVVSGCRTHHQLQHQHGWTEEMLELAKKKAEEFVNEYMDEKFEESKYEDGSIMVH